MGSRKPAALLRPLSANTQKKLLQSSKPDRWSWSRPRAALPTEGPEGCSRGLGERGPQISSGVSQGLPSAAGAVRYGCGGDGSPECPRPLWDLSHLCPTEHRLSKGVIVVLLSELLGGGRRSRSQGRAHAWCSVNAGDAISCTWSPNPLDLRALFHGARPVVLGSGMTPLQEGELPVGG